MSDQITYDNKVDLQVATNIANINKVTASDMNEIKSVVNSHADEIDELNAPEKWVSVGTTAPTDGRRVWFDTTSGEEGIYVDGEELHFDNYSTDEQIIGKWIDGKNLYRKVITITSINANANATDVSISLANLNEIVNIGGSVRTNSGQYKPVASIYVDGNGIQSRYIFSVYTVYTTTLTVSYGDWWKSVFGKANIIIEYTKTTN